MADAAIIPEHVLHTESVMTQAQQAQALGAQAVLGSAAQGVAAHLQHLSAEDLARLQEEQGTQNPVDVTNFSQELFMPIYSMHRGMANPPRPGCPYGNCGFVLGSHDIVGTTFYICTNLALALFMFTFIQSQHVPKQWKTPVAMGALMAGVSWYNYSTMKDTWIETQVGPLQYRYNDWLITVPMMCLMFYFIVRSQGPAHPIIAFRLLFSAMGLVFSAWLAIINILPRWGRYGLALFCYYRIVNEIVNGDCAIAADKISHMPSRNAYNNLKNMITYGWMGFLGLAIVFMYLYERNGSLLLSSAAMQVENFLLNMCDIVNKFIFIVFVWQAAAEDKEKESLLSQDSEKSRSSGGSGGRDRDRSESGRDTRDRSESGRDRDRSEKRERSEGRDRNRSPSDKKEKKRDRDDDKKDKKRDDKKEKKSRKDDE